MRSMKTYFKIKPISPSPLCVAASKLMNISVFYSRWDTNELQTLTFGFTWTAHIVPIQTHTHASYRNIAWISVENWYWPYISHCHTNQSSRRRFPAVNLFRLCYFISRIFRLSLSERKCAYHHTGGHPPFQLNTTRANCQYAKTWIQLCCQQ